MNSANTSSVAYPASTRYTGRGDKKAENPAKNRVAAARYRTSAPENRSLSWESTPCFARRESPRRPTPTSRSTQYIRLGPYGIARAARPGLLPAARTRRESRRNRLRIPDDDHEDPDERRNAAEHEEQPLCRDHVDAEPPSRRRPHAAGDSPAWLSAGGLDSGNSPDTLHR